MNRTRTLSLKKETVAELTTAELGAVAAGASLGPSCLIGFTCVTCEICDTTFLGVDVTYGICTILGMPTVGKVC